MSRRPAPKHKGIVRIYHLDNEDGKSLDVLTIEFPDWMDLHDEMGEAIRRARLWAADNGHESDKLEIELETTSTQYVQILDVKG